MSRYPDSPRSPVLVTNGDGPLVRFRSLARAGLPRHLRGLIAGPAGRLDLSFTANSYVPRQKRGPVDAVVADDLVLRTTLKLPRAARSSIASATRLHALEYTPFGDGDLLCHVTVQRDPDDRDILQCHLVYVPRSYIDRGLAQYGLRHDQLRRLSVGAERATPISLLAAYAPKVSRRRRLATVAPLALCALAVAASWGMNYLSALTNLETLSAQVALAEDSVATLARRISAERQEMQARDTLASALPGAGRSAVALLKSIAAGLPSTTEVRRAALSGSVLDLSLASSDLLADVRTLAASLPGVRVELVGTVVSENPGLQSATVRLTGTLAEAIP